MTSNEIREAFLKYFESKNHLRVSSSSLIPVGDPTLLLTTAGMVQFKPYFSGEDSPPNKRLTSSQKSFRASDIDEVGDSTHLTLFEMLGNFSIGDYFKNEAIEFSLECFSTAFGIPKQKFSITVHESDNEAVDLWRKAGIPKNRIYKFGDADNWWGPAGLEGPCGPCTELHYDFGEGVGCAKSNCGPNCTNTSVNSEDKCNRYVELWNLVFMQYYHHSDGSRTPLPSPSVDTGMGLERLCIVLQNTETIYETDLFSGLIKKVQDISNLAYQDTLDTKYAMRVVAEHSRSATFLIADGVVPSNEGRGYVLRRVVRRAIRHGRLLGLDNSFFEKIALVTIEEMGGLYPELRSHKEFIFSVLNLEEERFQKVFSNGYNMLEDALNQGDTLPGSTVFKLWDTYGFPLEVTEEIAREKQVSVDSKGFSQLMIAQKERARSSAKFKGDPSKTRVYDTLGIGTTKFLGYDQLTSTSIVVGLISDGEVISNAVKGDEVEIIMVETPFYPEGGGQVGDSGMLVGENSKVEILDTQTVIPNLIVHFGKITQGTISQGDSLDSHVNPVSRADTARNHTATHILHSALRQVLGPHVRQAGSLVAPNRLRFDFTHVTAMTVSEIEETQWLVNEKIRENVGVHRSTDSYKSAIERGALAFFGDKYDHSVRLVEISNGSRFSFEVCGGTHVRHTGEIGALYILSESSTGSGIRRIDAVSGRSAERVVHQRFNFQTTLARKLQTTLPEIGDRVEGLLAELSHVRQEKESLEKQVALNTANGLLLGKKEVNGVSVLAARIEASNAIALRNMGDHLRDKLLSGVIVLGSVINNRPILVAMVTSDLVKQGFDASKIAKQAAKIIQGGGGGNSEVAEAGGRNTQKLDDALKLIPTLIRNSSVK